MNKLNKLEKAIIQSAMHAHARYMAMSGGWWLWHAPESFLQHEVARGIFKKGFEIFIDASGKKTQHDARPKRGRKPTNFGKRFDITVWDKTSTTRELRAVIEIKRTTNLAPLKSDKARIGQFMKQSRRAGAGYLLAYSEKKRTNADSGRAKLKRRFEKWANELGAELTASIVRVPISEGYSWGLVLFRIDSRK